MEGWIELLGRTHALATTLPLGLLAGLAAIEIVAIARPATEGRAAGAVLAWIAAASAAAGAATGWMLAGGGIGSSDRLRLASAAGCLLVALLRGRARPAWAYRVALLATMLVLLPPALRGAGDEGPSPEAVPPPEVSRDDATSYERAIAPILSARCATCHGEEKRKGGLVLSTPDAIRAGGDDGPILVPGRPSASEIVRRLNLPLEDEDHMPPEGKPQPTAEEVARIEAWIAAGARFGDEGDAAPADAPSAAIEALRQALVHVEPVEAGSDRLWIDFAATAPGIGDTQAGELLEPVLGAIEILSLARSGITDASMRLVARMPRLRRLDLRGTSVTGAGLAALAGHARLRELVLAQTKLGDEDVDALLALPALSKVWLWRSGIGAAAIERLRSARSGLEVDAGDEPDSAASEVEAPVALTKAAPAPSPTLAPVNATCPVSGGPVDPAYAIVFRGRVVGFCCPKCPGQFWAEPAKFESKLP